MASMHDTEKDEIITKPKSCYGARHTQYILMFSAMMISYGMRTVLNNAVVEMVKPYHNQTYPTYPEWADKKNLILSSFFWGYICLQICAGQLAKNYGAKMFLLGATVITVVFTALTPYLASKGYIAVLVCRIIQGMCQGFLVPSMHTLLSLWAPLTERARFGGFVYAGQVLANGVSLLITGAIAGTSVGWPAAFYTYAAIGFAWCVVWFFIGCDSPARSKTISIEEMKWIESELVSHEKKTVETPWLSIVTSLPFLAILVTHFGENWGFWTLMTEIPSYMDKILQLDISSNSLLGALPFLTCGALTMVMSPIADYIIISETVPLIVSRKIFNSIGFIIPAIALVCLPFVSDKPTLSVALLVVAVGLNAGSYCGYNVNHIDISPTHAGTLMAITNSTATIASILAPLAVDAVRSLSGYEETDAELWNIIFYISAALFVMAALAFNLFASGEIQSWDSPNRKVSNVDIIRKASIMRMSGLQSIS